MRVHPLFLLLPLLAACPGAGDAGGGEPPPDASRPPAPAAPLPALAAGEDVALAPGAEAGWRLRAIDHAPAHFLAKGWADARTLWGLSGTSTLLVRADGPEVSVWTRGSWDAALAPDGSALAWFDERGVWVGGRSGEPRLLLARDPAAAEGDLGGPLLWSPGGDRLLVAWTGEAGPVFGVVGVPDGGLTLLPRRGEGFLPVEAFGWLDPRRVLLSVQPRLAGDGGRPEWRGLAVHDLARGATALAAGGPGRGSLQSLARWGEHGLLAREEVGGEVRIVLLDSRTWSSRPASLPAASRVLVHDTTAALLVEDAGEVRGEREHALRLWSPSAGAAVPLARVRGSDLRLAWSPAGDRIVVSRIVRVEEAGGSFREEARTHLLERRTRR